MDDRDKRRKVRKKREVEMGRKTGQRPLEKTRGIGIRSGRGRRSQIAASPATLASRPPPIRRAKPPEDLVPLSCKNQRKLWSGETAVGGR